MFSVVIPLFNEEDNLVSLIKEIKKSLIGYDDFELIFVNDCSTDDTLKILEKEKNKFEFKILNNNKNCGQSYSIYIGIKNSKYNTIVTLDGDGQNNPYDIPKLLEFYNKNSNLDFNQVNELFIDLIQKITNTITESMSVNEVKSLLNNINRKVDIVEQNMGAHQKYIQMMYERLM